MSRKFLLVLGLVGSSIVLFSALPVPTPAAPGDRLDRVEGRLGEAQGRLGRANRQARALTTEIDADNRRIERVDRRLALLRGREARVFRRLAAQRRELASIQTDLRQQRARLARMRIRLADGRRVLAARLVELYKADRPDVLTVVLSADGFADLLEDAAYMERIAHQDRRILEGVARAKTDAAAQSRRLGRAERRQRLVTTEIERDRRQIASFRAAVQRTRDEAADARLARQRRLDSTRVSMVKLRSEVRALRAVQARVSSSLQRAQTQGASPPPAPIAGPVRAGSGRFVWPVNGPITSPFCERRSWESCHPGLDIGAPEGTPIRAADAGRVVLLQPTAASGGYGNYTCVQHSGAVATCYAHQSRFGTSMGVSVGRGQVIGYVGNTGHSFGAHLHFEVRVNGSVVNPLNYL